ncbi:Arabinogalactan Endo-beta-1 4-galactanase [termite gut metagenome]|uniref:arabinogalactan endo-beta-1,4-galactanase n=1 Tax=termite gut metagenome TaxID=433724 RepID=A0A5J4SIW1_9ZZZZ
MRKKRRIFNVKQLLIWGLGVLLISCNNKPSTFSIGADISFVPQNEARGVVFQDENGIEKDICLIMADHHFDNIRLRIFVNPEAEKGYSPKDGFCDLKHTVEMAKRIKAAGMMFTLNFHYSDTWADPDKQYKPSVWESLSGEELESELYEYTKSVLSALKKADVAPEMVQIGNEINHGLLWPEGYINDNATEENWISLMGLYKAGQRAVREILPNAKLMIHLALGGENKLCRQYLDYMIKNRTEFDIIGLSYYEQWHETYNDLKTNLYDLAATYNKPVCVCEYGANKNNIKIINDIVRSVPNGLGYGTMAWEPTQTLFSFENGNIQGRMPRSTQEGQVFKQIASKEIFSIYDEIYAQYSNSQYQSNVEPPFKRIFDKDEQIIGADISWVPQQENNGLKFSDEGVEKDVLDILKDNKFNWIRLRLFVDPTAENGYSKEGYCGLGQTFKMAKRIKAAGLKFLLDFHYSDNWADPGKQFIPASWRRFGGSGLEGQIYRYSYETIKKFIEEGITPDMVQIGNEINHGMLWAQGKIEDSYIPFGVLLRCASAGVRAADPSIMIMVHIACGGQNKESVAFLDKILSRDVKFDIIGQSYYPEWHGTLDDLKNNLTDLAIRYEKPIIVVEYQKYPKEVNEIVKALPNGLGWGTFIWEATSPRWGNLFDKEGKTTETMAIYSVL